MEVFEAAVSLMVKSMMLGARWAGHRRRLCLRQAAAGVSELAQLRAELVVLRDENHRLEFENGLLPSRLREAHSRKPHYTPIQRLQILWHITYYRIPRSRVREHFGIAKSTLYRWLHKIEDQQQTSIPANKTPIEIAVLIWQITKSNINWGRIRIANQLALLNIFISASTVRNILQRPKPRNTPTSFEIPREAQEKTESRSIPAWYPNHVWSVDTTMVLCLGLWPIHIFVVIDHFSRKVMSMTPLEGPNAGWVNNALESAIEKYGPPKHIISDQAHIFTGDVFAELLDTYNIKPRLGAVGKHGSIAVTERVIKTLKYEWLKRATFIKGIDHLTMLCGKFETWYNSCRPHMTLDCLRPDDVYYDNKPKKPERDAKTAPCNIEQHFFRQTRIMGYRLKQAA